jgi:hypothetical protein
LLSCINASSSNAMPSRAAVPTGGAPCFITTVTTMFAIATNWRGGE